MLYLLTWVMVTEADPYVKIHYVVFIRFLLCVYLFVYFKSQLQLTFKILKL